MAASISTRSGPAVVWTAPTRYEGTCAWLEFDGKTKALSCLPKGHDDGNWVELVPTRETVLMYGAVADRQRPLDLHYADGTVEREALDGRFLLLEIPHRHLRHETRLLRVDIDGRRLATPLDPHAAAARTDLPLSHCTHGFGRDMSRPYNPGMAQTHGHSVDEYLETIYFLAFPIGGYRPASWLDRDRVARRRDARGVAGLRRRDAEAARGGRPRRAWRPEGGDPHGGGRRARKRVVRKPPDHRALPHRLHGLHRRRVARPRGRARRHVHG